MINAEITVAEYLLHRLKEIGYTVGATLGAAVAAKDRLVVLFMGDGAFQVTCQDVSTMIRYGLKPVICLINNDVYTIERVIVPLQ